MRTFMTPKMDIVEFVVCDVITTSPGNSAGGDGNFGSGEEE